MSDFCRSSVLSSKDSKHIAIYSPIGGGKTTLAATASQFFPKSGLPTTRIKPGQKLISLKDMLWFAFDKNACASFHERGFEVPKVIDVWRLLGDPETWKAAGFLAPPSKLQALSKCVDRVIKEVRTGNYQFVVVDTLSTLNELVLDYWGEDKNVPKTRQGERNQQMMYGRVRDTMSAFLNNLLLLPCYVIQLCHVKALSSEATPEQLKQRLVLNALGIVDLVPALVGATQGLMKRHVDLELFIAATPVTNKPGEFSRKIYTVTEYNIEGKNRHQLSVPAVVTEFNLAKILALCV